MAEIKEREPKVNPRLTFPFPLSKERIEAIEIVTAENPDPEIVLKMMESSDIIVSKVGLEMAISMKNMDSQQMARIAHGLESAIIDTRRDFFERHSAVSNLRIVPDYAIVFLPALISKLSSENWLTVQCQNMLEYLNSVKTGEPTLVPYSGDLDEDDGVATEKLEPLTDRKPLYATLSKEILNQRLSGTEQVAKLLGFIDRDSVGFIVNGSTAKGYMDIKSDLDLALVHKGKANLLRLQSLLVEKATKANICSSGIALVAVEPNNVVLDWGARSRLFEGLFYGDTRELTEIQQATILSMTEDEWDQLRSIMFRNETANITKAQRRDYPGSTLADLKKAKRIIALNRVPLPYEETKMLLEKRLRKANKKHRILDKIIKK